ncbi:MAG: hypothetical protein HZA54_02565 [Planctomycetes bacterium]|nr:hypothetical protein [Planctomycetota bacterium]
MKTLLKLAAALLVVALLAVGVAFLSIDRMAKGAVEQGASAALGVPTTLDGASVGIFSSRFAMTRLTVANPEGFKTPHFLVFTTSEMEVTLAGLRADPVEVPRMTISGIDLNLEKTATGANYSAIMDHMKKLEADPEYAKRKKFVIHELVLRDVTVHVDAGALGKLTGSGPLKIPELTLHDVGSAGNKGMTAVEVTSAVTKTLLLSTLETGKGLLPTEFLGELGGSLGRLKSLTGEGIKLPAGLTEKLGEGLGKAMDGLGKQLEGFGKGLEGLLGPRPRDRDRGGKAGSAGS